MKPDAVKQALYDAIQEITDYKWLYSVRPGRDNTRNRKYPFKKMLSSILAF
ncbi:MAG: IS4/IS5 family transposase, partial [Ruminococcaceae bacterium]|nr:IS4/IS5 family transposase [Oscillospiraceae bacterium]